MRWRRRNYYPRNRFYFRSRSYRNRTFIDGLILIVVLIFVAFTVLFELFLQALKFVLTILFSDQSIFTILPALAVAFVIYLLVKFFKRRRFPPPVNNSGGDVAINRDGYIINNNKFAHRNIAENFLKRKLGHNEVVHHLNGVRDDNRPENLCVMTREKHEHFHAWLRWKKDKNGYYPTFEEIQKAVKEEYSGILLR